MTLSIADRLFETTVSTGSGPFTLQGAVSGFQGFATLGTGKKTTYFIDDADALTGVVQKWMDVIGTVTVSGGVTTLSVDQVLSSSNNGSPVNFGAGTKNVRGGIGAKVLPITDENLNDTRDYASATASGNQHILTLDYVPLAYSDGMMIRYRVPATNTSTAIGVNVNGMGSKSLRINGAGPAIGSLPVGTLVVAVYRASNNTFEAINLSSRNLDYALNFAKGADIPSAATTDIGAATGNYITITGTTAITALGTVQAGTLRHVVFSGILTLTHNATSLILPGATNIVTAAGDAAIFVSEGSGNWRCVDYQRANGQALIAPPSSPLTQYYASGAQTITSGGLLTLPHGFGVAPKLIKMSLVCITADGTYSPGQEVDVALGAYDVNNRITMAIYDSVNIYIRYSAVASVFAIGNTSGTAFAITNNRWQAYIKAWA